MAFAESAAAVIYSSTLAAGSLLLAAAPNAAILDDQRLSLICLAGAIGGALLSVLMFPPSINVRALSAKFFGSGVAGVLFAPFIVQEFELDGNTDSILAVSSLVGLTAWATLQIVIPRIVRIAAKKVTDVIDDKT